MHQCDVVMRCDDEGVRVALFGWSCSADELVSSRVARLQRTRFDHPQSTFEVLVAFRKVNPQRQLSSIYEHLNRKFSIHVNHDTPSVRLVHTASIG